MLERRYAYNPRVLASVGATSNPLTSAADTGNTIVYVIGVGALVYFGLSFIAPLFIGAAGKTKKAKHEYSRIGREERSSQQHSFSYTPAYERNALAHRYGRGQAIDVDFIDS